MSIAAVQARIAQLDAAIGAVSQPVAAQQVAPAPASVDFGGTLATALATDAMGATSSTSLASSVIGALTGTAPAGGATGLAGAVTGLTGAAGATGATGAAPSAAGPAAPGTGAALVESAKKYLGVPYVWGGESLSEGGLDCSGLVQLAMKDIGVDVPRVAREQMKIGTEVPSIDQALPGDLVVTRGGGHIGIYVGENKWIHAPYPGESVKLAEMTTPPTTIRRVLPAVA